jgi:hypothetical protein
VAGDGITECLKEIRELDKWKRKQLQ